MSIGHLLDTSILIHLARDNPLGRYVAQTYSIASKPYQHAICVVTFGEIESFAKRNKWGKQKIERAQTLLKEILCIDINSPDVIEAYALIDSETTAKGQKMGKNDVWIAAAAKAANMILLTADTDFDRIHGTHVQRIWINPDQFKTIE